tara:strand:+ start:596 stop:835 length:240 start_codon:yes stop_codon:yes gene_type:complete
MNHEKLIKSFEQFADRMFTVAEGKDSEVIKVCPGWNVNDLMAHVGRVYGAVTSVINQKVLKDQQRHSQPHQKVVSVNGR